MKNLVFILGIAILLVNQACNNATERSTNTETTVESEPLKTESSEGTIHLTKADFLDKVWDYEASADKWIYKGDKPCIIDFYADWCGPCKIAAPILEELAIEYADEIYIYKIDTEQERELASAFGISSIPAFLYCPSSGDPQMAAGIGRTPEQTKEMFVKVINDFLLKGNAHIPSN